MVSHDEDVGEPGLRNSGISVVGSVPWGTHFTLFYDTPEDLLAAIVPFLAAGLEAGELCLCLVAHANSEEAVASRLRQTVADFDQRLAAGQLEFVHSVDWLKANGRFNADAAIEKWRERFERAAAQGYPSVRASGERNRFDFDDDEWRDFLRYEGVLHEFLSTRRALVVCGYALATSSAAEVFDVACAHHFAIARRRNAWEILETPALAQAKAEIQRLNAELERRVEERTRQLAAANTQLRAEVTERMRVAARLARVKRLAREHALSARFTAVLEERTRMAREIHDSLLQGVTGIALQLRAALPHLRAAPRSAVGSLRHIVELAEATIRDARQAVWDMRVLAVAQLGLMAALEEELGRAPTGVQTRCDVEGTPRALEPQQEDTIFRVAREALTNAFTHAQAGSVVVKLSYRPRSVHLTVSDDGRGFRVEPIIRAHAGRWGLLGMRERAERIGATLAIRSRLGSGTTVELRVRTGVNRPQRASGVRRARAS